MARIYQPLQRKSDQRYDMTVSSDDEGWTHAIGYCAAWREFTREQLEAGWMAKAPALIDEYLKSQERLRPFKDNYHADGHATEDEANACYEKYLLDVQLVFGETAEAQHKCEICEVWTTGYGTFNGDDFVRPVPLCKEHQTREHMKTALDRRTRRREDDTRKVG